jgi:hypothetical protein
MSPARAALLHLLGGLRCIRNHGDTGPWNAPLLCNAKAPRQPVFLLYPLLKKAPPDLKYCHY